MPRGVKGSAEKKEASAAEVKTEVSNEAEESKAVEEEPNKEAVMESVIETTEKAAMETAEAVKETAEEIAEAVKDSAQKVRRRGRRPGTTVKEKADKEKAGKEKAHPEVYVQYDGNEVKTADVVSRVKELYKSDGHRESSIKSLEIYLKPAEHKAYYVINKDRGSKEMMGSIDLF